MKVVKLPSGNYNVQVYIGKGKDGKRLRKSFTGPDRARVLQQAAAFADEHRTASDPDSFGVVLAKYIDMRTCVLSPSTIRSYVGIQSVLVAYYADFCRMPVWKITSDDVQSLVNSLVAPLDNVHGVKSRRKQLTVKTVRNYVGLISSVLKDAGYNMPNVRIPERIRPQLNVPDEVTMRRVINASRGTDIEIPILLAATGPLRRGEICALKISDFNGTVVHIHRDMVLTKDNVWALRPPKTLSSDRYIDLPADVVTLINERGSITDLTPDMISSRFKALLRKNGIAPFRFHDIRHYCASMMKAKNIPDIYIQQRGGWATNNTLNNIYTHTLQNQSVIMTNVINKELMRAIK